MWKTLVGLFFYVLIGAARAIYSRWVLSPKAQGFEYPLVLAFCTKICLTIGYVSVWLVGRAVPRLQPTLYGPPHHNVLTHWKRWTKFIVPLILTSVAALSLDTIAYTLVDLTTKQVIDACMPLVQMLSEPCAGCIRKAKPSDETLQELYPERDEAFVPLTERRKTGWLFWMSQKTSVLAVVAGTVLTVFDTRSVSTLGIAIDASTLFPVAWGTFIQKFLLHQPGWTYFVLLAVTALPETFLMAAVVYAVHGQDAFTAEVFRQGFVYAGPLLAISIVVPLLGFTILKETSEVSYTIAVNAVMATVIFIDLFYLKDRDEPSQLNWIGFGVFATASALYASTLWWTRLRPVADLPGMALPMPVLSSESDDERF
jgi:hypothetical protein